jgi:thiol-disulfide isomerase/thioredoxin
MLLARVALFALFAASASLSQTAPDNAAQSPDGLTMLRKMSQRYADAHSLYFTATEEVTQDSPLASGRHKVRMVAAVSGRMYHYEGSSGPQAALLVSDGTIAWDFRPNWNAYTQKPLPPEGFQNSGYGLDRQEDYANLAAMLKADIAGTAGRFLSATRLPDTALVQGGMTIPCFVVEADEPQNKRPKTPASAVTHTFWIDQANWTLRKEKVHREDPARGGSVIEVTTTYETTELDSPLPETLFHFTPPRGAERVAQFNDNPEDYGSMVGRTAPEVQVVSAAGDRVPISSYRGKPVLLDFWATWCGFCVLTLPQVAELYKEASPHGLVLLSVDEDKEGKKGANFLAQRHFTWPNTVDRNGTIEDAYGLVGLPHILLIDAKGKIVYDGDGDQAAIRRAVAGLGPQFASLAPPPSGSGQTASPHP